MRVPTPPSPDDDTAEIDRIVRLAVSQLREHADGVQIFVTKSVNDGEGSTWHMAIGAGNWFARYGLIRHWINKEEGFAAREYPDPEEEE